MVVPVARSAAQDELIGRLVALGFAAVFAFYALAALRRGRMTPTRDDREYVRATEPAAFWFHVAAYAAIACAFAAGAAVRPRLVLLGLGVMIAYFVLNDLRTGRVKPSRHDRVYTRSQDAGTYWFHVVVGAILAFALVAAGVVWS